MHRPLNILQVSSARVYGGNEEHIRTLVRYLPKEACRVRAAVPADGEFARVLEREGVGIVPFDPAGKLGLWSAARRLARWCRRERVDVIHSHNRREDAAAALAGRLAGVPVRVSTIHDRINMTQEGERSHSLSCRIYNWTLRRGFDALIAVSDATRRDVIDQARVPAERVHHVVNGMDLARLQDLDESVNLRTEWGFGEDDVVCGMVARVRGDRIGKKGHRYLLEAVPKVVARAPHARFLIVGADADAAALLRRLADERGAGDRVLILGYRRDALQVMRAFDIAVLPSLFEGLPRTLMEAMALGKPAVGTRVDGIAELIAHEECGLLVEPRDADGLAAALLRLIEDPDLRARMGRAARRRIAEHFDGRRMAERTCEIYRELAETKGLS